MHIGADRQLANAAAPFGEHLVALAGIAAEADRAADMVEYDLCLGNGSWEICELTELRMVHPGIEAEAEWCEAGETFAHMPVRQQPFWPGDHRPPRPFGQDARR